MTAPSSARREQVSELSLRFRRRGAQTALWRQHSSAPLKVLRPFQLDDGRAALQLLNVGPGVMGGDRYRIHVHLEAGAQAVLINQSATKLHSMLEGDHASQRVEITLEEGAELEFYPGLTIPFAQTEFEQQTIAQLEPGARFALIERWSSGRVQRGEAFGFRRIQSSIRVEVGGRPVYADALDLDSGAEVDPASPALLEGFHYVAAGLSWWPGDDRCVPEALTRPPTMDAAAPGFVVGVFGAHGRYLRALASDGLTLDQRIQRALARWRSHVGLAPCDFARFTC